MSCKAKIELGRVVATPGVLEEVSKERLLECLARHACGDWGEALPPEDAEENDLSVKEGFRILSAYYIDPDKPSAGTFWIITEADRSVTTCLRPIDY